MFTFKNWLLVAASLALASPGLEAGKMKITIMPEAAKADPQAGTAQDAIDAGQTRSMRGVATVLAPPAAPRNVVFDKILQNQTLTGSDIYLLARGANPLGFAITRVLPGYDANGGVVLNPQPFVAQNPSSVNGVTTAGAAPLFANPLYNAAPRYAAAVGGYVAAVAPAVPDTLFAMPTNAAGTQPLLSTAFAPLPAVPPAGPVPAGAAFTALKDANGADTGAIAGLVAGKDAVFAAVAQGNNFFANGANNRGIAKVTVVGPQLAQQEVNMALGAGPRASQVSLVAVDATANPQDVGAAFHNNAVVAGVAPGPVGGGAVMPNAVFDAAAGNNGVVMHYDAQLDRVFVGLRRLQKSNAADEGGLIGVLVGVPTDLHGAPAGSLGGVNFRSIIHNPSAEVFGALANANECNRIDSVVGMYHGPGLGAALRLNQVARNRNVYVSVHHLKTMHTSTGRSYLIVASEIGSTIAGDNRRSSGLYFVPIMGKQDFTAAGLPGGHMADVPQVGKLANNDFTAILAGDGAAVAGPNAVAKLSVPNSYAALPLASRNCITNTLELLDNGASRVRKIQVRAQDIIDLQVVGDTVFIAVNGNEDNGQLLGAYQTTAIFDAAGNIKGWTPLQRVSSVAEAVRSLAVDSVSGAVMYLENARGDTFNVADWATNSTAANELKALIAKHFPADKGGVRGVHTFDSSNPAFMGALIGQPAAAPIVNLHEQDKMCSLLVLLGYDKVMVVQTAFNNRTAKHFRDAAAPVPGAATFAGAGNDIQNVFVFDSTTNPDLKNIAPLTCAEVLKVVPEAGAQQVNGYLYVGGFGGVCRLQGTGAGGLGAVALGNGWETRAAGGANPVTGLLSFAGFVADASNPRFVKANNAALKDVRKIISTAGDPAAAATSTQLVCLLGDGYVAAAGDRLDLVAQLKVALPLGATYAFDAVLVKNMAAGNVIPAAGGVGAAGVVGAIVPAANPNTSYLIIATEQGLVVQNIAAAANNTLIPLDSGDMPIQLAFEPRGRGGVVGGGAAATNGAGMLYVLAGSQADGNVRVHRFGVEYGAAANAVLLPHATPTIITLPMFRRYFATDGTQFLFGHDRALDTYEMLNQSMVNNAGSAPQSLTWTLGNAGLGTFSSAPIRESVSGAWIVPGSFGIRVND